MVMLDATLTRADGATSRGHGLSSFIISHDHHRFLMDFPRGYVDCSRNQFSVAYTHGIHMLVVPSGLCKPCGSDRRMS
jgi:hypothetical protein